MNTSSSFQSIATIAVIAVLTSASGLADRWENRSTGIEPRVSHTTVIAGPEIILWGGGRQSTWLNDGARYELATDTWRPVSQVNAPSGRWFHGAAWTGTEMIIWGGRALFGSAFHREDGGLYNPRTDTWRPMSTLNAPQPRGQFVTIWTGSEMIVWGGETSGYTALADGARYNPQTGTWAPIASSPLAGRFDATAVWTGTEMIIWGGLKIEGGVWTSFGDGARYNPTTDRWRPINSEGAPGRRNWNIAVWTGEEMMVWGGKEMQTDAWLNDGGSYNPATDSWTPIASANAPSPRILHAGVWSGSEMIVWGGEETNHDDVNTGGRYNPRTRTWTPTTLLNAPQGRHFWRPDSGIWTGEAMFISCGIDYPIELNSTDLYYPEQAFSATDALQRLLATVRDSSLPRNKKRPLAATLEAALQSLEHHRVEAALNQLHAFLQKVQAQLARRYPELAERLTAAAQEIIDALQAGAPVHLTAMFVFSSDEAGNPAGNFVWDTRGLDSDFYKIFVMDSSESFINGPTWAEAPVNLQLKPGENHFTLFFQANGPWNDFALNLFFDNNSLPGISVKAPLRTGQAVPPFSANSSPRTYSMTSYPQPNAPASGTSSAELGDDVELTEFFVADPALFNVDLVSTHNVGRNGAHDFVASFTLVVGNRSR